MKSKGGWRVQKGNRVTFAIDRVSGEGVVVKVYRKPGASFGFMSERVILVRADETGLDYEVTENQIKFDFKVK